LKINFLYRKQIYFIKALSFYKVVLVVFLSHFIWGYNTLQAQKILNGNFQNNTIPINEWYALYFCKDSSVKIPDVYTWSCAGGVGSTEAANTGMSLISSTDWTIQNHPTHNNTTNYMAFLGYSYNGNDYDMVNYFDKSQINRMALKLSKPLVIGKTYRLKYLAAVGVRNDELHDNDSSYNRKFLPLKARIGLNTNPHGPGDSIGTTQIYVKDNVWQAFNHVFTATQAATFITFLGIMKNDTNHRIITQPYGLKCTNSGNICTWHDMAYTYFDNIELEEVCPMSLGADTTICLGKSLNIKSKSPNNSRYLWSNGDTTANITVNQTGKYWLTINSLGCIASDTIVVNFKPFKSNFLAKDTTQCLGKSLIINSNSPNSRYQWSNGDTTANIAVNQKGKYWITINSLGCIASDTIVVNFKPFKSNFLAKDTTICQGKSLNINSNSPNSRYQWSNGDTTANITVNQKGKYWLTVNSNGCIASDTIQVNFTPKKQNFLPKDTSLCQGQSLNLSTTIIGKYLWNNNDKTNAITVSQAGIYSLAITDSVCTHTDSIYITILNKQILDVKPIQLICKDSILTLNTLLTNAKWHKANGTIISPNGALQYKVSNAETIYISSGLKCLWIDSIYLTIDECNPLLRLFYFPNAFSPNDDGSNEEYNPTALGWERKQMSIYNRWGELLFTTQNPIKGWDGTYKNNLVQDGVYLVKITLKANDNTTGTNPYFYWSGTVTLLK